MEIIFLGTGTSQGVPVIACDCEVCKSKDPKDNRLRSSIIIKTSFNTILLNRSGGKRFKTVLSKNFGTCILQK